MQTTDANIRAIQGEIEEKLKDEVGSMVNVEDRWQVLKKVVFAYY